MPDRPNARSVARIEDVARLARVSPATVSRALSQPALLRAGTLARVEAAIAQLSYVPHAAARTLASNRSRMIGALLPTLDHTSFALTAQGLQTALADRGYTLVLACHGYDLEAETRLARELVARGVDGLFFVGLQRSRALSELLRRTQTPYVVGWNADVPRGTWSVGFDNRAASALVVDHLVGLGHRRIALVAGLRATNDRARARAEGVLARLAAHGIAIPPAWLRECPYSIEAGAVAAASILDARERPTALVGGNDAIAIGMLKHAREAGIDVPGRLSVAGFDDQEIAGLVTPGLTTVRFPAQAIGERAAEALVARIEARPHPRQVVLGIDLVVRLSTGPVPTCAPAGRRASASTAAVRR